MRRRILTLLLAPAALMSAGPVALAGPPGSRPEVTAQIQSLRAQVLEASAEEAAALGRLDEAHARRRQVEAKVASLDQDARRAERQAAEADARLQALQADFVRIQSSWSRARDRLAVTRGQVRERAVAAYLGDATTGSAELLLRTRSVRELAVTARYVGAVVQEGQRAVDRYRAARDTAEGLRGSAEAKRDVAKAQYEVAMARQAELESARSELDAARRGALAEESHEQALLSGVRSRIVDFESQIAVLRSDSESVAGLLRAAQLGRGATTSGSGPLGPPVPGAVLVSPFGPRVHPILGTLRMHTGIDYGAAMGTPIRSAAAGTVVHAGPRGGYGNTVVIDHGGSLATLYAHQSAVYATPGAVVSRGQVVGAVGSTGLSTGPHLHFEVRMNGTPVNPLSYL